MRGLHLAVPERHGHAPIHPHCRATRHSPRPQPSIPPIPSIPSNHAQQTPCRTLLTSATQTQIPTRRCGATLSDEVGTQRPVLCHLRSPTLSWLEPSLSGWKLLASRARAVLQLWSRHWNHLENQFIPSADPVAPCHLAAGVTKHSNTRAFALGMDSLPSSQDRKDVRSSDESCRPRTRQEPPAQRLRPRVSCLHWWKLAAKPEIQATLLNRRLGTSIEYGIWSRRTLATQGLTEDLCNLL